MAVVCATEPVHSAVYFGRVRHGRVAPRRHDFSYRLFMMYLDLDELPGVFARFWFWSVERPNVAAFYRRNYLGQAQQSLTACVLDEVQRQAGFRPSGRVAILTHLSYFGLCFNPVSFYFCWDKSGQQLEAVIAEITNTPWLERHAYVLPVRDGRLRWRFAKTFHVSPFHGMDHTYEWAFSAPGEHLGVHMRNIQDGRVVFDASLALQRRPWNDATLAQVWFRYPAMSLFALIMIYWHAGVLWWRGATFHPHPATPSTPG